jgi:glycosyltransferase involved in cell wall biosynthesis
MTLISVVVPIFNEELILNELIARLQNNLNLITADFEVIIIDDGSSDLSWQKILENNLFDKRIKGIKFSRNFGHHQAITAGLHKSKGEWVIVMDGDLQDRPEVIPELYKKSQQGFDVVFVSRKNRPEKRHYLLLQGIFYFLLRILSGIRYDSSQANFSIINRKVVEAFKKFPENSRFYLSTIKWLGFKNGVVFADHGTRFAGKPSYTFRRRIQLAFDIIFSYSERPLKFAIFLGSFVSVLAIIFSLMLIYAALKWGFTVLGWPSLIISIFFLNGSILIVLGIIGIYLGRVFKEVKHRPLYVIEENIQ